MKNEPLKFTTCAMCGKQFIKQPGHMYKVEFAGKQNVCCSYTCYQNAKKVKAENNQPEYRKYRKEVESQ